MLRFCEVSALTPVKGYPRKWERLTAPPRQHRAEAEKGEEGASVFHVFRGWVSLWGYRTVCGVGGSGARGKVVLRYSEVSAPAPVKALPRERAAATLSLSV